MKTTAVAAFHRPPENLNCAQAVLAAYHDATGDRTLPIAALKPCGGGRAPDGLCGALHAACVLAPDRADAIKAAFLARIGALRCKEIEAPCLDCVGTAAGLLEQTTPPKA